LYSAVSKIPVIEDDVPEGVELYDHQDFGKRREYIFSNALDGLKESFPQSYGGVRLELADVDYVDPDGFSLKQQRDALLQDKFLSRRIRGKVKLFDDTNDTLLDEQDLTLMRVPYLTDRGTFIHGGNEYTSITQARLTPGSYSRRQRNGELETQFNIRPGTGSAFRVALEPETSQYRLRVQQANLHLYSLLKDLGVSDDELVTTWGPEILDRNRKKYDARVFEKAFQRLVPAWQKRRLGDSLSQQQKAKAIRDALDGSLIDERVARTNLPNMFDRAKAAAWREEGESFEKEARKIDEMPFAPDLTPDQMSDEVNRLYNAGGARLASLPEWPDEWLHQSAPKGWIDWYSQYQQGARGDDDDRQIQRWKMFKARHGSQFKTNPTPRRAFALRNWAIDPLQMLPSDQRETFSNTMNEYKRTMDEGYQRSKAAGTLLKDHLTTHNPEIVQHPSGIEFMNKVARFGAGVLFRQPNGKYLLEKNHPEEGMDDATVGKLRPAGGGKSKRDHSLRHTIIREIGEEFGLDEDFVKERIVLLGYQTRGKYRDCPIFEMWDHGLTPGRYQATNSDKEFVDLVEADLDDPNYIGPKLTSLRKYQRHYRPAAPKKWAPWNGVDLDGTLAESVEPFDSKKIGDPVPAMVTKVKNWVAKGKTVKIFTARAAEKSSIPMIQAWCRMHGLPEMEVTNQKDPGMRELWDDRAVAVVKNKGVKKSYMEAGSFTHEGLTYDMPQVLSSIQSDELQDFNVSDLAWMLEQDTSWQGDPDRVAAADTTTPIIVSPTADGQLAVVDGLHRLAKAVQNGEPTLQGRIFSPKYLDIPAKEAAVSQEEFLKGDWAALAEYLNQVASAGINLNQSASEVQEDILRFLELQQDASPAIMAVAETAREMAKRSAADTFQAALDADDDVPDDVRFYTDGANRCTIYFGDWHEEGDWDSAKQLARKHFSNFEDPDDAEIGRPDWVTKIYSKNSPTKGATITSRFITPYELEGYSLSPEIGRARTGAIDLQVFGPQSEIDKLLS
jgi:hypothetical protein